MAPTEHGECFVLADGGEADLDLGNYERYLSITLTKDNSITSGKVIQEVLNKERRGSYLGRTVQIVPHLVDAMQEWIQRVAKVAVDDSGEEPDVCVIELGGTVGDIESSSWLEAMRQLRRRAGKGDFLHIHVCYVPVIEDEQKTKLTQQAIKDVRELGLWPDLIACRCSEELRLETKQKIANFCQVEPAEVVAVRNVASTYHVPMLLEEQGLIHAFRKILNLDAVPISRAREEHGRRYWTDWRSLTTADAVSFNQVKIALVGKYTRLHDSYMSVVKALEHAAMHCRRRLNICWIDSAELEVETKSADLKKHREAWQQIQACDGILIPGGFGDRGTEGMISAIRWARENSVPFFGICLGMQLAVIEAARNLCKLTDANSKEFAPACENPVIIPMEEIDQVVLGGTMRLGLHATDFQSGSEWSKVRALYGKDKVFERHRHRYEVNPKYVKQLESTGLMFTGKDESGNRMEILERQGGEWFVGVQFHPEFQSRVLQPSCPILGFVAASAGCLDQLMLDTVKHEYPSLTLEAEHASSNSKPLDFFTRSNLSARDDLGLQDRKIAGVHQQNGVNGAAELINGKQHPQDGNSDKKRRLLEAIARMTKELAELDDGKHED